MTPGTGLDEGRAATLGTGLAEGAVGAGRLPAPDDAPHGSGLAPPADSTGVGDMPAVASGQLPPEWNDWSAHAQDTYAYLTGNGYDTETARDMAWRMHLYGTVDREAPIGPRPGAVDDSAVAAQMHDEVRKLGGDAQHDYVQLRQMGWTDPQASTAVAPYDEAAADMSPYVAQAGGAAVNDYLVLRHKGWSDADASTAVLTGEDDIARPSVAEASGDKVTYTYDDGSKLIVSGGTQNLRNHNPGNMVDSAGGYPTIGRSASNKFVTFPDEETGFNAEVANLERPTYQRKTVSEAIKTWAPASDHNDPATYGHTVAAWTGLDPNTPLQALTLPQLVSVANAIQRFEGSQGGAATIVPPESKGR